LKGDFSDQLGECIILHKERRQLAEAALFIVKNENYTPFD